MAILSIGELLGMGPSELSGLIPYSGLEYSGAVITGISGSALGGQGGGTDSATVSAIASAYAESAASSKVDQSAFSSYTATALAGYVPISAVSSWSSQIETLSSAVSSLSAIVSGIGTTYTLSAGYGIQISSNTASAITIIRSTL